MFFIASEIRGQLSAVRLMIRGGKRSISHYKSNLISLLTQYQIN